MSRSYKIRRPLRTSKTLDSLAELAPKTNTPSTSSSGYGSQAVSSTNLSTDDSTSLRSISVDETPDFENKPPIITESVVSWKLTSFYFVGKIVISSFYLIQMVCCGTKCN